MVAALKVGLRFHLEDVGLGALSGERCIVGELSAGDGKTMADVPALQPTGKKACVAFGTCKVFVIGTAGSKKIAKGVL